MSNFNNKLLNNFQNFNMQNNSFKEPVFYNKMQEMKLEQLKKAKNIKDLGINKEQLLKFVICPFKEVKLNSNQLLTSYKEKQMEYPTLIKNNINMPKILTEWWNNRTNMPYKNILKKEDYSKKITAKEDLIIYKVSNNDKDKIKLESELNKLLTLFEKHNYQLKVIFSASEENKHKEEFEYVHKTSNRVKFDPKNNDDLKTYYKKEQKKMTKENKRIDEMIELLLENENEIDIDSVNKLDEFKENDNDNDKEELELKTVSIQESKLEQDQYQDQDQNQENIMPIKNKKSIKVKTNIINSDNIGIIEDDIINQYKNRQKKI